MASKCFTDTFIASLKARDKRYEVIEPTRSGLRVRVSTRGTKTFVFVYRQAGRLYRKTIGTYPAYSLADARAAVAADRLLLAKKQNPVVLAKARALESALGVSQDMTVSALVEHYLERHAKPNKKTWREDDRVLKKDVVSRWGDLPISAIERRHVAALLDDLLARGAGTGANRTLALVRKMFSFAVERGLLAQSPCVGIKKPKQEKPRQRVMTQEELRRFWRGLDACPLTREVCTALKLILVTAQRPSEVAGMHWSEIDWSGGWWTIPAERAKNGLAHRVYLSTTARRLLRDMHSRFASGPVFRSRLGERSIGANALDHGLKNNLTRLGFEKANKVTPHDLRRTAASAMTSLGVSRLVVAKVLNHAESGVTAVYDRHSYDAEKRAALEQWGDALAELEVDVVEAVA